MDYSVQNNIDREFYQKDFSQLKMLICHAESATSLERNAEVKTGVVTFKCSR